MARLGAVPVNIPSPESYTAIERGTLDGVLGGIIGPLSSFKIEEVGKHLTYVHFGSIGFPSCMNMKKWNTIPSSVQKVMQEVAREVPKKQAEIVADSIGRYIDHCKKKGVTIYDLTAAEHASMVETAGKPVWNEETDKLEAKGIPGKQALSLLLKSVEKYGKK
jgi:TRAP-type C4-dicarboxylate transport system substrate-binding protein